MKVANNYWRAGVSGGLRLAEGRVVHRALMDYVLLPKRMF